MVTSEGVLSASEDAEDKSIRKVRSFSIALETYEHNRGAANSITTLEKVDSNGRHWDFLDFNIDWISVRSIAVPITTKFTFRTNGTCQSPRIPGIGWSYFGADPDWGEKQANQLKVELEASLANFDVKVASQIQGKRNRVNILRSHLRERFEYAS
jgi:hypothetical protein